VQKNTEISSILLKLFKNELVTFFDMLQFTHTLSTVSQFRHDNHHHLYRIAQHTVCGRFILSIPSLSNAMLSQQYFAEHVTKLFQLSTYLLKTSTHTQFL